MRIQGKTFAVLDILFGVHRKTAVEHHSEWSIFILLQAVVLSFPLGPGLAASKDMNKCELINNMDTKHYAVT